MPNITVLGAGRVGKAIALNLAKQHQVIATDIRSSALNPLTLQQTSQKNITVQALDVCNHQDLAAAVSGADVVVSAVPGF